MPNRDFYVYRLSDPRTGKPFYIGKGCGYRIDAHEAEARKGLHSRKCAMIRQIWDAGLSVKKEIVSRHECEAEALDAEEALIDEIGLANLTNVLPGGKLGFEAYENRKRRRQQAAVEAKQKALEEGLGQLAPSFARAIRAKHETGGFGLFIGERWVEFSEAYESLIWDMAKTLGFDRVAQAMRPYGIELKAGNGLS